MIYSGPCGMKAPGKSSGYRCLRSGGCEAPCRSPVTTAQQCGGCLIPRLPNTWPVCSAPYLILAYLSIDFSVSLQASRCGVDLPCRAGTGEAGGRITGTQTLSISFCQALYLPSPRGLGDSDPPRHTLCHISQNAF